MGKYALILNGVVEQVVEDERQIIDITTHAMKDQIAPGWEVKGKAFYEPRPVKYARVVGGEVVEVLTIPHTRHPKESFAPEIADQLVEVTGDENKDVDHGWKYDAETKAFSPPPPPPPPDPVELAKAEFARRWPMELQLQVALEKIAAVDAGEACPAFEQLQKDRQALKDAKPLG